MKGEPTFLGDDIRFHGKLYSSESVAIHGEFKGYIQTAADLVISPSARVNADIDAVDIVVEGSAQGNLFASKKLELRKHSQVVGDVRTAALQIDVGARLRGTCIMD